MSLVDDLKAASVQEDRRGTVPQSRLSAEPVAPAYRMAELTARLEQQRRLLAEAANAVERLERNAAELREDRYHRFGGVSFGGVPMAQHWCDLVLWEAVLNERPDLKGIVEIGTWQGGFSGWLWAQTELRVMGFATFDATEPEQIRDVVAVDFECVDVWRNPEIIIRTIRQLAPCVLFCDGGNKPRELKTFGKYVGESGLVAVHDWGTEMPPEDVPDELEMIYGDYAEAIGGVTRFFCVRKESEEQK